MDIATCAVLVSLLLCRLAWASVLVYADAGTSHDLSSQLLDFLKVVAKEEQVRRVMADELARGDWMGGCKMLIIPAGRDLEYVRLLPSATLRLIRQFIEGGGSYLGICGGAYFASGTVVFEPGTKNEVVGTRELALFPGTAYGSAYSPFTYSLGDMRAAPIEVHQYTEGQRNVPLFHMGGCCFDLDEVRRFGWDVIGTYTDINRPAMIGSRIGKGKVMLICPHIEFNPELATTYSGMKWYEEVKSRNGQRQAIFQFLFAGLQPEKAEGQTMSFGA